MADVLADGRATLDGRDPADRERGHRRRAGEHRPREHRGRAVHRARSRAGPARRARRATSTRYDYVLIDCPPNLGLLTVNGLVAANSVIIPVQTQYYAMKGLNNLVKVINVIRMKLNRDLRILGLLPTLLRQPDEPRAGHARRAARRRRPPRLQQHRPQHRQARRGAARRPADHVVRRRAATPPAPIASSPGR